ncbi:MAG TPA: holo-ACP synthase [Candidatus Methylacidiphilales bacterium]|nr:holo-ACP synthase [Candidatus Methylacidiphilales bacterium]
MNILGVGVDIVETKRIAQSLERFGDRFLQRVFAEGEIAYARSMKFPHLHLAARFAAKEAISKAFGTGIGHDLGWRDLEIVRAPGGAPGVRLHGRAESHAKSRGVTHVLISLSHTAEYGAASAVIVG